MKIQIQNIGKRFNREWIFKNVEIAVEPNSKLGIIGSNGSGKSTLLKLISGAEIPTEGKIIYSNNGNEIELDQLFKQLNYAAPYIDLPEELTLSEHFDFHSKFKTLDQTLNKEAFFELINLTEYQSKFIKNFSSGMKQRLKLGLAMCFESNLILLDEPCSNLDKKGIELYKQLIEQFGKNKTLLIGSNEQSDELHQVENLVNVLDFKVK